VSGAGVNGQAAGDVGLADEDPLLDLDQLLVALQAMRVGDFSVRLPGHLTGRAGKVADTFNDIVSANERMAEQLEFVGQVVGREGKTRTRVRFGLTNGAWAEMETSVNTLIDDLVWPMTAVTRTITAVAKGDLLQTVPLDVDGRPLQGEFLRSATIVNTMIKQLSVFTSEVTRVAREVGTDGKLGGQAQVSEVTGVWRDLTESVNSMASNLTGQVRNIAEVATAVTKGDLSRAVAIEASGEVAELKDNTNTMIGNLRLTTDRNTEQDWLKTNLARFTNMLQGQRDLSTVGRMLLSELAPLVGAHYGVIYQVEVEGSAPGLKLLSAYADTCASGQRDHLRLGEGLIGQCAQDARWLLITEMPAEVAPIGSGLFKAAPRNVIVLPVLFEGQVKAVIELASLGALTDLQTSFLEQRTTSIGIVLNSIEATMQTEGLLTQSQQLAGELQTQQSELQQTNEQLEQKAQQLAERNVEVEAKNQEIEQARRALEEKATELALTSKYKSEFLANMSHELRTPLNSILILGQQLNDNPDGNLSVKQVEFARTIHGAGTDLLNLITDILDLSKIESGTTSVDAEEIVFGSLLDMMARPFRHEAESRRLSFEVTMAPTLERSMITDAKRLHQVLKNLLSNAFKFTEHGGVRLTVSAGDQRLEPGPPQLEERAIGCRLRGDRHGYRHSCRETAHHLRGLPAGGRLNQS
jgi:signal transduction histidine kinase/HAMP domain-containing protein